MRGIARARVSAVQRWKENGSFLVRASAATKLLQIVLAFIAHTEYRRKIRVGKQRTHNRRSAILDPCSYVRVHANRLPTHRIPATRRTNPSVSLFAMWQVSVSPCQSRISAANRGEHESFAKPNVTTLWRMVAMALIERFLGTKLVKHSLELAHVQPALLGPLIVLLELRCGNELQGHGAPIRRARRTWPPQNRRRPRSMMCRVVLSPHATTCHLLDEVRSASWAYA